MRLLINVLAPLLLLSGCVTAHSSAGLSVVAYSKEIQSKAADEIQDGYCPIIGGVMMPDYSVLRDQARIK